MFGFLKKAFQTRKNPVKPTVPTGGARGSSRGTTIDESSSLLVNRLLLPGLPIELDISFSALAVVGANTTFNIELSETERKVLIAVEDLVNADEVDAELLPRVPAVIPRLLRSIRDENANSIEIAQEIAQDPTIVGEVIRVANSAYYRTKVSTSILEQALSKLGLIGLRQVIATIAFRSIIDVRSGHFLGSASPLIWKQTETSAHAARCLATHEAANIFDAYLAALVQNIGYIVALKVLDRYLGPEDLPRSIEFHRSLSKLSLRLTPHIVKTWDFPADITSALEEQTDIENKDTVSTLGSVLYAASRLSKLFLLEEKGRIQVDPEQLFGDRESNQENSCALCYKELAALGQDLENEV